MSKELNLDKIRAAAERSPQGTWHPQSTIIAMCDELEKSPWIPITPETMPKDRVEYFVMLSSGYAGKDTFIAEKQLWNSRRKNITPTLKG